MALYYPAKYELKLSMKVMSDFFLEGERHSDTEEFVLR